MSTVDVVIHCYNCGSYLQGCVASVLFQTGVDVRVLIVDDAATDNTAEIGRELAAFGRKIEFRQHEVHRGDVATYNESLIGWSNADYVVLLSAEDVLAAGSLTRAVQIMDDRRDVGMVYGQAIHFRRDAELPSVSVSDYNYSQFTGTEWLEVTCRDGKNLPDCAAVVARRSIQRSVGGYSPELLDAASLEMWMRIAAVSNIARVDQVPQAFSRKNRDRVSDLRQRRRAFAAFFERPKAQVPGVVYLQDLANRSLAREALQEACRLYESDDVTTSARVELIEFALSTYDGAKTLFEYASLRQRQSIRSLFRGDQQPFALAALKANQWLTQRASGKLGAILKSLQAEGLPLTRHSDISGRAPRNTPLNPV